MEKALLDGIVQIVQTVGFPIVVCGWFMFRLEKRLDEQTKALNRIARQHTHCAAGDDPDDTPEGA